MKLISKLTIITKVSILKIVNEFVAAAGVCEISNQKINQ
jgi:hypothetical protein